MTATLLTVGINKTRYIAGTMSVMNRVVMQVSIPL